MIEKLYDEIIAPEVFTETGIGCDNIHVQLFNSKNKINTWFLRQLLNYCLR